MSLRSYLRSLRKGRLVVAAIIVLVAGGTVAGVVISSGHGKPSASKLHHHATPPLTKCPLTGLPAPGGKAPEREPLAVKIGNEPQARPQSGLNEADIVYDTPAEGGVMRYVAVYQCETPSLVGPIRSVRWVDWHILEVFKHVELAFVAGINPNRTEVESLSFIDDADAFLHALAYQQNPDRQSPDSTYASAATLWRLFGYHAAPEPVFDYTTAPLPTGARPAKDLAINFSGGTDVVWQWNSSTGQWVHTYSGVTDTDALTNQPVTTTNIIVQVVHYNIGPDNEDPEPKSGDVESQTVGTGKGWVLRNGEEIRVTWHRASLTSPTTYTSSRGQPVDLTPGRTWVEFVLDTTAKQTGAITITP
jgi:hypothetical protein